MKKKTPPHMKQLLEERSRNRKMIRLARKLKGAKLGKSFYGDRLIVYIDDLDGLTPARARLRKVLGKWTDEVGQIWCSGGAGGACVSWKSKDHPFVEIWMTGIAFDDFPESLLKPGCGFKEIERPAEVETVFACEVGAD